VCPRVFAQGLSRKRLHCSCLAACRHAGTFELSPLVLAARVFPSLLVCVFVGINICLRCMHTHVAAPTHDGSVMAMTGWRRRLGRVLGRWHLISSQRKAEDRSSDRRLVHICTSAHSQLDVRTQTQLTVVNAYRFLHVRKRNRDMQRMQQVLAEWQLPMQIRWQLNALHARRNVRILCRIVMSWQTETHQQNNLVWSLALIHDVELRSRFQGAFLHWKCQIAVRWALKGFMVRVAARLFAFPIALLNVMAHVRAHTRTNALSSE